MSVAEFREAFQHQIDLHTNSQQHWSLDMARADAQLGKSCKVSVSQDVPALGRHMTQGILRRFVAAAAHIPDDSKDGLPVSTQTAEETKRRLALMEECRMLEAEVTRARADNANFRKALVTRFQSCSSSATQLQERRLVYACQGATRSPTAPTTEGTARDHQDLSDQFEQSLARLQHKLEESRSMAEAQSDRKGNFSTEALPTPGAYVSGNRLADAMRLLEGSEDAIRSLEVDDVDRDLEDAIRRGERACRLLSRHLSGL